MNKRFKGLRNWIKEIVTGILLIIEAVVTFAGFIDFKELTALSVAIIVADVSTILYGIHSFISKFDTEQQRNRYESHEEHKAIQEGLKLNSNIKSLNEILLEEDNFVNSYSQDNSAKVAWIISNDITESDEAINIIYNNLKDGLTYYYVIPDTQEHKDTIASIIGRIIDKIKDPNKIKGSFKWMTDKFFSIMPADVVSFLFYMNPNATEEEKRLKGYYCFHECLKDKETNMPEYWYNPIKQDTVHYAKYISALSEWGAKFDSIKNALNV